MSCCWYFCRLSSLLEFSETWLNVGFPLEAWKPGSPLPVQIVACKPRMHSMVLLMYVHWPCVQKVCALKHILLAFIVNLTHQRGRPN